MNSTPPDEKKQDKINLVIAKNRFQVGDKVVAHSQFPEFDGSIGVITSIEGIVHIQIHEGCPFDTDGGEWYYFVEFVTGDTYRYIEYLLKPTLTPCNPDSESGE